MYGRRDDGIDGSYIATQCFCVLFLPVVPIRAYRVSKRNDGSLVVYATVPLSPLAKNARVVLGLGLMLLVFWIRVK
jgi:hypothetical protein